MFKSGQGLAAGGTIMYDLNIENAKKVLTEDQMEKQKGLGVRSKRSPIINLKDFLPDGMTMDDFREYLLKEIFAVKSLDDIETYHMSEKIGRTWINVWQKPMELMNGTLAIIPVIMIMPIKHLVQVSWGLIGQSTMAN